MCGASLVKQLPDSIRGQVIGRNGCNSLIPFLSYCCSLAVAIVTADLSPACRRLLRVPAKLNSLAGVQPAVALAVVSIYLTCQGVCL